MAFSDSTWFIGTFGCNTIALVLGDSFYVFDSHARNRYGNPDPSGASILLQFEDMQSVLRYLHSCYEGQIFNLSPLHIIRIRQPNTLPAESNFEATQNFVTSSSTHINLNNDQPSTNNAQVVEDHSYHCVFGKKPKGKRTTRRTTVSSLISDVNLLDSYSFQDMCDSYVFDNSSLLNSEVAAFDTVISSAALCSDTSMQSFGNMNMETNQEFELYICDAPSKWCKCCDRFLFPSQVKHLERGFHTSIQSVRFSASTDLCRTCCSYLSRQKMPALSSFGNSLGIDSIPEELSCLSSLEKKLLAKIQVCMSMVLLPGGQYAEKGLIVNLPNNVESFVDRLDGLKKYVLFGLKVKQLWVQEVGC